MPESDQQDPGSMAATLATIAQQFSDLSDAVERDAHPEALEQRLVQFALLGIPGAEHAALTIIHVGSEPRTVASTGDLPLQVDSLQYTYHQGPCLDAAEHDAIVLSPDLTTETQWPAFAPAVVRETPVRSMLSFRLQVPGSDGAALNLYAKQPQAFTEESQAVGAIFAAYSSVVLLASTSRRKVGNLERALASNREIGVAMGILMARELCTEEQAFDQLREASQRLNRKLADIARQVTFTGEVPKEK